MNIFKMFGIQKHWPTKTEWAEYQQGLSDTEARSDAERDFNEANPIPEESVDKPYLRMEEARKAGIIADRKPAPERGTVSRTVRQRTSEGYPSKEKIIRRPGDYINPPMGESNLDR